MLVMTVAAAALVLAPASVASAANPHGGGGGGGGGGADSTCDTGTLTPGTYNNVTVSGGFCQFAPGTFLINGALTVDGGGVDATNCDTHVTIEGGVSVINNGVLGLGGSVIGTGCAANTNDVVNNGLRAIGAAATIIHGTLVNGGLVISGGGFSTDCEGGIPGLGPAFSDIEDNVVNGGVSVTGLVTCWFGAIRNHINGGLIDKNNTFGDPDANEVQTNVINGPLNCSGNSPAVQQGDSEGLVNIVSGPKTGECAKPGI
jgi:hypothetical protein